MGPDGHTWSPPGRWCDHPAHLIFKDKEGEIESIINIAEPYGLKRGDFETLAEFCREKNITVRIGGDSVHNPNHFIPTIQILLYPKV